MTGRHYPSMLERVQAAVSEYGGGPLRDAVAADLQNTGEAVRELTLPQRGDQAPDRDGTKH